VLADEASRSRSTAHLPGLPRRECDLAGHDACTGKGRTRAEGHRVIEKVLCRRCGRTCEWDPEEVPEYFCRWCQKRYDSPPESPEPPKAA
jgi:hypothetical protein